MLPNTRCAARSNGRSSRTPRDGSHGHFHVPGYIASVRSGKLNATTELKVERLAPGVVKVDGFNGFAPLALEVGREPLAALARAGNRGPRDHQHPPLRGPVVGDRSPRRARPRRLRVRGRDGLRRAGGGTKPLYGTHPMSYAWPRGEGRPPLCFDQASSASARGEIMVHRRDGEPIPEGWGIDADGNPTTDPAAALAGAQLPFGGYKGASIALMIELLAGALVGDLFSFEASAIDPGDGGPPRGGELVLAIDPAKCSVGGNPVRHAESLFARVLEQEGARLPSDRRYAARLRTSTDGIAIPRTLHDTIASLRRP